MMEGDSLRRICNEPAMPTKTTVCRWLADPEKFPLFCDQYARAREVQAEMLADELIDISDEGTNDWMEKKAADGSVAGWALNGEHVQRSRLRIDTRKWAASKLLPKKYGDRITNDHVGNVTVTISGKDAEL